MDEFVQELIEDLGARSYKQGVDWNGYKVFIPQYKGNPCIGLPYVVLQKGEETRISTPDESMAYLEYELHANDMGEYEVDDKDNKDYTGKGRQYRQNTQYANIKEQ